jgi:hypothetical protein
MIHRQLLGGLQDTGDATSHTPFGETAPHVTSTTTSLPLYGVAHSLGGGVLTLVETKRPGTFAVSIHTCLLRTSATFGFL